MSEREGVPVFVGTEEDGYFPIGEVQLLDLRKAKDAITELLPDGLPVYVESELVIDGIERPWLKVTLPDDYYGDDDDFEDAFIYEFPAGLTLIDPFLGTAA